MSYNPTTGVISSPVTLEDVKNATGWQPNQSQPLDLENLCLQKNGTPNGKINMWARYRPTGYGSIHNRKQENGENENKSLMYGLAEKNGSTVVEKNVNILKVGQTNFTNNLTWDIKADLTYCRLQDFNGYNKNAKCNITSDFFKPKTMGQQEGFFYNAGIQTVVNFIKDINFTSEPPQCWEDESGDNFDYCSRLYFEELFPNTSGLNNLYLGLAFVYGDNAKILSLGKTFGYLMNNNINENILLNGDYIGILNSSGGRITVALDFKSIYESTSGGFVPVNTTFNSRLVLIQSGRNVPYVDNLAYSPNGSNVYSCEITTGFCKGTFFLTKLNSYINIKNISHFGDYICYNYAPSEINENNINSAINSSESQFNNRIYLERATWNSEDSIVSGVSESDHFKFRLVLSDGNDSDYVCYQFYAEKPSGGSIGHDNIQPTDVMFVADGETVSANVELYLKPNKNVTGFRFKKMDATNKVVYGAKEKYSIAGENFLWKNNGISPTHDIDYGFYSDVGGRTELTHCTAPLDLCGISYINYLSTRNAFSRTAFGYLSIRQQSDDFDINSGSPNIYIYVPLSALGEQDPNNFKIDLIYSGVNKNAINNEITVGTIEYKAS